MHFDDLLFLSDKRGLKRMLKGRSGWLFASLVVPDQLSADAALSLLWVSEGWGCFCFQSPGGHRDLPLCSCELPLAPVLVLILFFPWCILYAFDYSN